jgi:hypothetical protein
VSVPTSRSSAYEDPRGNRSTERLKATFEYASFVGHEAVEIVDTILRQRGDDAVIVVFSDHGTGTGFDSGDPFGSDINERSSNILAVRTPGHPNLLPAGTTPINVLPRILNAYLGTDLPYRPDTTWAWDAGHSILDAVQVDTTTFQPKR